MFPLISSRTRIYTIHTFRDSYKILFRTASKNTHTETKEPKSFNAAFLKSWKCQSKWKRNEKEKEEENIGCNRFCLRLTIIAQLSRKSNAIFANLTWIELILQWNAIRIVKTTYSKFTNCQAHCCKLYRLSVRRQLRHEKLFQIFYLECIYKKKKL